FNQIAPNPLVRVRGFFYPVKEKPELTQALVELESSNNTTIQRGGSAPSRTAWPADRRSGDVLFANEASETKESGSMRKPAVVTVTGAAGRIAYALLFRIASGQMLGPNTPVRL